MDKVTLSSPVVVVVVGLPGSGKSFFAAQFAKTFGAAMVSEDKIRWLLFAHHTYNDNENAIVSQVADMMVSELFKTRKTFVLDGGYNDSESREAFAMIAKKAGFKILTVVVQTDLPTAKRRATHRDAKKAGDKYMQSLSPDEFATQAKRFQAPVRTDKTAVVISGKHTYSTQVRIALKKMLEIQGTTAQIVTQHKTTPIVRPRGGPFIQ